MSDDRFKFISPGVFIEEIDQSAIPELPERMGPVVVGRFKKGPSNRPVKVKDYNELVQVFGSPSPGNASGDIWRTSAMTAPTYAAYAAQAWLRNNTPCTIVRLLGVQHEDATGYSNNPNSVAGWRTSNVINRTPDATTGTGGAYGLLVMPDPDAVNQGARASSVSILITAQADIAGQSIRIGIPSHLAGGLGTTPDGNNSLIFAFETAVAGADQTRVNILAQEAQTEAALDEAMNRLVTLINDTGGVADLPDDTNYGAHTDGISGRNTLASVQDALTASWTTGVGATGTLTLTSKVGGNLANNIRIVIPNQFIAADETAVMVMGTTMNPATTSAHFTAITASAAAAVTGTLAATWYINDGYMRLMGNPRDALAAAASPVTSSGVWIRSANGANFHAHVMADVTTTDTDGAFAAGATFNFDPTSDKFIRKAFNTDPTATNSALVDTAAGGVLQKYWLGETFEDTVRSHLRVTTAAGTVQSASAAGDFLGCIVGLKRHTPTTEWADRTVQATAGGTGWFFSQDKRGDTNAQFDPTLDTCVEKLFRFISLDNGEHTNRDIKISLADIKQPPNNFVKHGTFTVLVRAQEDTDSNPVILERYTGVNLDPTSSKYILRALGDKEYAYDAVSKTVRQFGSYENKSKFVRAVVSPLVEAGNAEGLLPFGVYGPVVPDTIEVREQANHTNASDIDNLLLTGAYGVAAPADIGNGLWVVGANGLPNTALQDLDATGVTNVNVSTINGAGADNVVWDAGTPAIDAAIRWPSSRIRVSASEGGLVRQTQAYFGYQSNRAGTRILSEENFDHFRGGPSGLDMLTPVANAASYSWIFSLDDIVVSGSDGTDNTVASAVHTTGSRHAGTSRTAISGTNSILDLGFNRFTSPVFGGSDGLNITEKDPFRNRLLVDGTETTNYAYNTINRAVNVLADPEFVEFDIATIPGCTNHSLTDNLIVACETRGDALAIVDCSGSYEPPHEGVTVGVATSRRTGSVDDVVANMKARGLNSSYGCAFFPFVQIRDTVSDAILFVPPSVVALGTMSSSQRKSAVWFAPAGFTRGGLSEGSSGLPVVGVRTRVTSDQRDKLYDANVNPIASFPAEGIVVFGQKTLQVTPSALDRINVRRLLIFLKKEISRIASRTLFEQNVESTWDRFKGQVNPFLASVKAGNGLVDYKLVLDKTTTTDDMVDRNIMYAKIFIKPARAIEFIALDFIITRSGASFDD